MSWMQRYLSATLILASLAPVALAQKEFGFDNRKPSGQPYLTAEESVKRLKVAPGYEVSVFAAEPDVINPVAFTVDERGRLWVVECFEYPSRTPKGKKPRDRIKVLEDTDNDGKADKVTVFAEGKDFPTDEYPTAFDLATGIEVGHGGVFLGAAPFLWFLQDKDGDGKCDSYEILLRGFGSQDTHETLNTFQWGPDGRLYGLHGVFTHSTVKPGEPGASVPGVKMNAAVWRYDARTRDFEIFAEGTSNPWGMDFDSKGQCFLACCVIPHLFHMVPGGTYKRQAGSSFNPHAYGLLNEACDHTHHKESGWAHAGLLYLDGEHVPEAYRGSVIMGSIHGCSVKRDVLRKNGSTFLATHAKDFLVSGDKNFRPINLRWGPGGAIYLIDWHDQNPCHQAKPDSWDKKHGRVYVIRRKGVKKQPAPDLGKLSDAELLEQLNLGDPWKYRTILRLIAERRGQFDKRALLALSLKVGNKRALLPTLRDVWALYALGGFDEETAAATLKYTQPEFRLWAVRLLGESGQVSDKMLATLTELAKDEKAPAVRLQLASTAQRLNKASGGRQPPDTLPLLHNLMKHKEDAKDPFLPLMIWLAYEPRLTKERDTSLEWLRDNAAGNALVTNEIVPRTVRRLVATGKADDLEACVAFLGDVKDSAVRRKALEGFAQALQNRQLDAPAGWRKVFAKLVRDKDAEVQRLARRLAVNFGDAEAIRRALAVVRDTAKSRQERLDAVRDLALAVPAEAREPLQAIVRGAKDMQLRIEACRALAGYGSPEVAKAILAGWKDYPPALRTEAVNLLAGRKPWAAALLTAVGDKRVPRTELTDNTILRIHSFKDAKLNEQIEKVWGRVRSTPAELAALIDKMRGELHKGPASFERGRKVFENQCAKCHTFAGRGHEVGPVLDGAARDIEYLLANVLDPNRVVGAPYFTRLVERKDGRVETGLLVAEDERSITLKAENDARKVIQKKDVADIEVSEKSVMPEGLGKAMSVQDFRDLIRYVMAHPFLTEVSIAGSFSDPPAIDPARPEKAEGVQWRRKDAGAPGRIALPAAKGQATAYVAATVTAPGPMRTRLMIGATYPVEVWLNGKRIYQGKPSAGPIAPDQTGVDVELKEGKNVLFFRIRYGDDKAALYARLLDPDRKLRYPEGER